MRIIICEVVHLQYTWMCIHKKIPIIAPPPPPTGNIKVTNKGINKCKYLLGRLLVLTTKSRKLKPLPTPIES